MRPTDADVERLLGRPIAKIERRPSPYRSSFELEEVDATLTDGTRLALMLKDVGPESLSADAIAAKPAFLREPSREVETYRHLLGSGGEWGPVLYGSELDPEVGNYWILMERIDGRGMFQVGEIEIWQAVARWLARFHRQLTEKALTSTVPLVRYDRDHYLRFAERALEFGHAGPHLQTMLQRWDAIVERLLSLPQHFMHGEMYASNVLVEDCEDGSARVAPVDWELAAFGPGLVDLAALTSGSWSDRNRLAISLAYHDELPGDHPLADPEEFLEALDVCRLYLAVQWLGWSATWTPPPHLAYDWSSDAEALSTWAGAS